MAQLFETEQETTVGYARVALEQGIDAAGGGLTYAVPASLADLAVGDRVVVPLGRSNRKVNGYIVQRSDTADHPRIKPIISRDPRSLSLTGDLVELARWMAAYYCCPLGMVFATMLPAAVKHGTGAVKQVLVGLSDEQGDVKLTKLQRTVLACAQKRADDGEPWTPLKQLAQLAGARTVTPLKLLIDKGLLQTQQHDAVRAVAGPWQDAESQPDRSARDIVLNKAQEHAIERLAAQVHNGFSVHLLHGVTGSGKTEVYLRVIEHVLGHIKPAMVSPDQSRGAIVLVPEIALTPQTAGRFYSRFHEHGVAVLHSGLTAAQRHEQWRRIRDGAARIVVGARSAIFAPMQRIGVIIVDEEHDSSYKQDQLPRYHGRDVAIKRAQLLGAAVVLGSATPSLESYANAIGYPPDDSGTRRNRYHLLKLPDRVTGLKLPHVEIVDMVKERRKRRAQTGQGGVHLLSLRLETLLGETLKAGGQTMLLLNRRGYANYIACPDHRCGWMMNCNHCDATMVYHKHQNLPSGGYVCCHHCHAEQMLPPHCPQCDRKVTVFGLGTQRVEEELGRKFPQAVTVRMDSDTMRTSRDYYHSLERFGKGEVHILVGTQMIAKGLDFPNVRLVGVISGDTALHLPDFRASERTFQLIAQVAGRAGRGSVPSRVIVQTFNPQDKAIALAAKHDYETYAQQELETREAVGLPPITRMARIVLRDRDLVACIEHAKKLSRQLNRFNQQMDALVRVRGPAPCPIARIAGFHRYQIELIAPDAVALQNLMTALRNAKLLHADARTAIDVDPVALM